MYKITIRTTLVILFSIFLTLSLVFPLFSSDTLSEGEGWYLADRVVALVNTTPILQSQIDEQYEIMKKTIPKKELKTAKFKILDEFIDEALLMQAADRESIIISDEKVDTTIEDQMKFRGSKNLEDFKKLVEKTDKIPFEMYRKQIKKMLVMEQIMVYSMDFVPPSEADAKAWYEENKKNMLQVRFQHILITPKDDSFSAEKNANVLIENVRKRALAGESFGALARQFSQDKATARNDGVVDWISFAELEPRVAYQVYNMKKRGTISDVFKSSYGYHIVKFYGRRYLPYEEIRDRIFAMISQKSRSEQFQSWVQEQRKYSEIVVYLDGYSDFREQSK